MRLNYYTDQIVNHPTPIWSYFTAKERNRATMAEYLEPERRRHAPRYDYGTCPFAVAMGIDGNPGAVDVVRWLESRDRIPDGVRQLRDSSGRRLVWKATQQFIEYWDSGHVRNLAGVMPRQGEES